MSRRQQTYDQWLRDNLVPYSDRNRAFFEIDSVLQEHYPHNLKIKADYYVKELLLCIFGNLPLLPPNHNRPCSVEIWIPKRYPMEPPMSFLVSLPGSSPHLFMNSKTRLSIHYEPNMPLCIYINNLKQHISNQQQPSLNPSYNSYSNTGYNQQQQLFSPSSFTNNNNSLSQFPGGRPITSQQQSGYSSSSYGSSPGSTSSSYNGASSGSYQAASYNNGYNYNNNNYGYNNINNNSNYGYNNNNNNNYGNVNSSYNNEIIEKEKEQDRLVMEREAKDKKEKEELRKSLVNKLKSRYKKFNEIIMSDVDEQISANSTLSHSETTLKADLAGIERLQKKTTADFRRLESSANDSLDTITELSFLPVLDSSFVFDLDQIIEADGVIPKQIMTCLVKDLTIHDLIYSLSKSFLESRCHLLQNNPKSSSSESMLTTTNYLRLLRELAREQFIVKATLQKINGIFPIY